MVDDVVNLEGAAGALEELWSPRVVARVNDEYLKVAKVHGEFVWHAHDEEDELFIILRGSLRIELERDTVEVVELARGDAFVVPKGVRHNVVADEECWLALIEPVTTAHTGSVVTDRTRSLDEQLGGPS